MDLLNRFAVELIGTGLIGTGGFAFLAIREILRYLREQKAVKAGAPGAAAGTTPHDNIKLLWQKVNRLQTDLTALELRIAKEFATKSEVVEGFRDLSSKIDMIYTYLLENKPSK